MEHTLTPMQQFALDLLKQDAGRVNGAYIGSYQGFRWSNTVEVTVKDNKITDIVVLKPQLFAKQETIDTITQRIISAQSTDVDLVSGATADCKAYIKAIENALKNQ
mgnify:CR=1 FL=1